MYSPVEKLLADVPFGRFFASSHLGAVIYLPSGLIVDTFVESALSYPILAHRNKLENEYPIAQNA